MPSAASVFACAFAAAAFWSALGFALSRTIAPTVLAVPMAPALGWAVHSAVALPIYSWLGFSAWQVTIGSGVTLGLASLISLRFSSNRESDERLAPSLPLWAFGLAALLAIAPALAIFPKISPDAVTLASPIFDHSKVAMIDEMARLGLPPGNPFFGGAGGEGPLTYYYLWHFSAAELSVLFGLSGWEADICLTYITAFSSLSLMMGFASWIGHRISAGLWVLPLALAASLYTGLKFLAGEKALYSVIQQPTGFAGWLFQSTWAPQHVASATCVVLSAYLLGVLVRRPTSQNAIILALIVVAGYESSTWVGGVLFGIASVPITVALLAEAPPASRVRFIVSSACAAILALVCAYPFIRDQFFNIAGRQVGSPITLEPAWVFSESLPDNLRRILDIPGYWLLLLVIEFPAIYLPGLCSIVVSLRSKTSTIPLRQTTKVLAALALSSLLVAGFLTITFADNNDLGWRSILPAVLVLTIFAAIGLSRWLADSRLTPAAAATLLLLALSLPSSFTLIAGNVRGTPSSEDKAFAATPSLWEAVQRQSGPAERIANNPRFMEFMTPWPVNISWALLADRRSCYAGRELALPFTSLPRATLEEVDSQFRRVFDGKGSLDDVRDLAARYNCHVVVLTPKDGAWLNDPFAASSYYVLADEAANRWRIYRAAGSAVSSVAPSQ
jgi:hypothetical protein